MSFKIAQTWIIIWSWRIFQCDYDVAFVSYAWFTASNCCISHYVGIYMTCIKWKFGSCFTKRRFASSYYFAHKYYVWYLKPSTGVKISTFFFFWEKWGDEAVDHEVNLYDIDNSNCNPRIAQKNLTKKLISIGIF